MRKRKRRQLNVDKNFKVARAIAHIVYPFFHCKTVDFPEIKEGENVIFVANHNKVFSPISTVLSMPVKVRIWLHYGLTTKEGTFQHLTERNVVEGTFKGRLLKLVIKPICRPISYLVNSLNPIAVYKEEGSYEIAKTMRESVKALENGERLLIFPEDREGGFDKGEIHKLKKGFVIPARQFVRKTEQSVKFCPFYINQKKKSYYFGKTIEYNKQMADKGIEDVADAVQKELVALSKIQKYRGKNEKIS